MTFEIAGQMFVPDYKSKEKRLYQVIASRESEIRALNNMIAEREYTISRIVAEKEAIQDEIRALKAKERRRATKRKKGREQPETE